MPDVSKQLFRSQRAPLVALLAFAALGIIARAALSGISMGTSDAVTWEKFGRAVAERGVLALYASETGFNHPPIMGWLAGRSFRIAQMTGLRFPVVFRILPILADAVVCGVLWRIWRGRDKPRLFAATVVAIYAWNPCAILVSAFHCNTDSIYAMLILLAVWLIEDKRAHFWGGLMLGAAINVKLIPVLCVFPLLASYRGRQGVRPLVRFTLALILSAGPFAFVLYKQGPAFARNALAYASNITDWGLAYLFTEIARRPTLSVIAGRATEKFHDIGRWLMLSTVVLWSLYARRVRATPTRGDDIGIDRYRSCTVAAALFLVLASGFGTQYTIIVAPLLMAVAPFVGTLYGLLAGMFLLLNYLAGWFGGYPIDSVPASGQPIPGAPFGLLAWALLVNFVWREVKRASAMNRTAAKLAIE